MQSKQKRLSLSPEVLLEIEDALNDPLFLGIPVGSTINDALINKLYNSGRVWNWRPRVTDYVRYHYQKFRQPPFTSRDFTQYAGRIVFTWLFDRVDLKKLVLPLVEEYGPENSVVVGSAASMEAQLADQTAFILWDEFPKINMRAWRREFDRCVPAWRNGLKKVLERHDVPQYATVFLLGNLQVQTQRIMASKLFLDLARPKAIVTEYDRNDHASCLVLAAKHQRIPTVTMIHGCLEPYPSYGLVPILADYACCWGERHEQILMDHGVNQKKLIITGCQRLSRSLEAEKDASRLKIGLAVDRPAVLLATSPIKPEDKKHYASIFCSAMSRLPDVSAIVRLHPAENLREYQDLIDKFPGVTFLPNETLTQDESLAAADMVVNHESGFGNDALLKRKLVVVLDVLSSPLKNGKELVEMAGCPIVKGADDLESVIRKILGSDNQRNELRAKADQYSLLYCDSYGQDAAKNVCRVINNAIESRG